MKKYLSLIILIGILAAPLAVVGDTTHYGGSSGSGVSTASNCDVAAYYAIGKLCQDTDDGKLYKGTGAAVEEVASNTVGTVTNGKWCVGDGSGLVQCTEDAPAGAGDVTSVGDDCASGACTAFTIGGIKFGDTSPDADAEAGFASNKFIFYGGALVPATDNAYALGDSTGSQRWSDIFLGDGAVINFYGGDVTLTHGSNVLTLGGGDLALGANSLTMTGSLGATGARVTKGWFTDVEVTNAIAGSITGNAATATAANEASDTTCFPAFVTAATGSLGIKTNAGLTFNSATAVLTATGFAGPLTGNVTGNASTATNLADGDKGDFTCSSGTCTVDAGAIGFADIDIHGATAETTIADADEVLIYSVANSANRKMTKGNFVAGITSSGIVLDLADDGSNESTSLNEISTSTASAIFSEPSANKLYIDLAQPWPSSTLAATVTVVDSTDTSSYVAIFDSATGSLAAKTDAGLTYNAGTGVLTATGFAGPLTGNVTGNVTGNASGTAATVTGAAQAAITSVGTLTSLTVSGAIVPNGANTIALGSTSAEWADIYLGDGAVIYGQNDQSATLTSSASTWTASAFAVTGALAANGNVTIGDADTDTLTLRSLLVGGNSRAVWIAGSAPTPSYATGTNELYVAGDIETAGTIYAAAANFGSGTDGSRSVTLTSNSALTPSGNQIYFIGDVLYFSQGGASPAQKTPARLEDAQTFTGKKTFQGDIAVGDASNAGSIDMYDGSSNYLQLQVPSLSAEYTMIFPTGAGTTGQYLKTTTSGTTSTLSWDTPSASADTTGGTGGVQFNAAGVLTSDAGFVFTTATDKLALGSSGGSTTGTLDLYYTGTTYAATITPNASMSADVTITLPDNTSTLIGSGANTFTGSQIFSNASNNSTVAVATLTGVPALNGSDVHRGIYFAPTGSVLGTITSTGNTVAFIDLAAITGDAETNLYGMRLGNLTGTTGSAGEVEYGISIGTGWDRGISTASPVYIGDGTNGTTISTTGGQSFAGSATFTAASATSSVPWVVGSGTAANTAEGTAYWESDTDILTIGDGASGISFDLTANTVITFPGATSTLAILGANTFTGTQAVADQALTFTTGYIAMGSDPADAGAIRLSNAQYIYAEADAAGTDISVIGVDSSEVVQIAASGASATKITPSLSVGPAAPDDVRPTLSIIGDADSDAAGDTTEAFTITLTANANPTLATWGITSTQSAGYTFDKPVQAPAKFASFTGAATLTAAAHNGALVMMTTADEVTMWDCTSSTIGHWVTLWARDAEKIEVVPASGDQFYLFAGTGIGANDELDVAATAGTKVTLMCTATDEWRVVYETAACTDGGAAD